MKNVSLCVAGILLAGLVGMGFAQDKGEGNKRPEGRFGTLIRVDGTNVIIRRPGKETREITVETNEQTVVTIDTRPGKLTDLREGSIVMVSPREGVAVKIAAATTRPATTQNHTEP